MHSDTPHILREFDQAFAALRNEVISMAGQARLNLERAMQGLLARDLERCKAAIADDDEVDEAELRIDRIGQAFLGAVRRPLEALYAEGNAFGASPPGTSAEAPGTATGAEPGSTDAAAPAARTP